MYGALLIFSVLFIGIIYALVAPKVWRGESGLDGDVPPEWWFLGDATWRGVARAYIATAPFVLVVFAAAIFAEFGDNDTGMAIAAIALLMGALVHAGIVLFNRPRALVPPHLRDEPGALAARRARRRRAVG